MTVSLRDLTIFIHDLRILPRNSHNSIILGILVFDNFISFDKIFAKALQKLATCLLVSSTLWGKLFLLAPVLHDNNLKSYTSLTFFAADFNLLRLECDKLVFTL